LSLKKAASAVAIIGIANVFGYATAMVRQAMIAAYFGAQSATDAYVVAETIPSMLEYVLAGAAIRAALLPVFTSQLEEHGKEQAWKAASSIANLVLLLMVFVMVIAMAVSPVLVRIVAPGLNPETTALARSLLVVMLPIMVFASGIGIGAGLLNALRHFTGPAMRGFIVNSIGIACIYAFAQRIGVMSLAVGLATGTAAAFLALLPILKRYGGKYQFRLGLKDPVMSRFLRLAAPLVPSAMVTMAIDTIDRITASYLEEGSLAIFSFAKRIGDLPLVLFGTAIATVIFPTLAARATRGETDMLRERLLVGLRMALFITVPAAIFFIALNREVVGFLLERGRFTSEAAAATGLTLALYSIGLGVRSMRGVVIITFYALEETKTVLKLLAPSVIYKAALNYLLALRLGMGVSGIMLATSISNAIFFTLLIVVLRNRMRGMDGRAQLASAIKITAAGLAMAASIVALPYFVDFPRETPTDSLMNLLVRGAVGVAAFLVTSHLLKVEELGLVKQLIREKLGR
jgi:putative peptidoglycan lipid II flippase